MTLILNLITPISKIYQNIKKNIKQNKKNIELHKQANRRVS